MKTFYRLIQGDSLKVLPSLRNEKVKLVIVDPPYLVSDLPQIRDEAVESLKGFSDSQWSKFFSDLNDILEDGVLCIFGHLSTFFRIHRFIEESGFVYVTDLVWVKPAPVNFLKAESKPLSQHETITVWRKGGLRYNYKEACIEGDPYVRKQEKMRSSLYGERGRRETINTGYRYMTDVIFAPNKPHLPFTERTCHPTQKPESLIGQLIKAFSFRGDVVLDPFLGSGTTMKACQDLGRSCIGIEINPRYCQIVKERCFGRTFLDREVEYRFEVI